MKNIVCYGDSLTHGWVPQPHAVPTERYPLEQRWPGVVQAELGDSYRIIEEGLSGRTTNLDDPLDDRLNGASYLPACLASHLPLDLVVVMLGTNDTKTYFHREPFDIATGIAQLLGQVARSAGGVGTTYPAPAALVVAPPPLVDRPNPWFHELFADGPAKTKKFAKLYRAVAEFNGAHFFDAGSVIETDGPDGIHWSIKANQTFGRALAPVIRGIVG